MRKEIMLKSGLFDKWKPYIEMSGDLLKIWKKTRMVWPSQNKIVSLQRQD
jgi:hypothetical protein